MCTPGSSGSQGIEGVVRMARKDYLCNSKTIIQMGKGDKRSKRGKIWRGSFGNSRPKVVHTAYSDTEAGKAN
jgi:ribosomal small subunit protein bTHX